jgi:hypothetical protein
MDVPYVNLWFDFLEMTAAPRAPNMGKGFDRRATPEIDEGR